MINKISTEEVFSLSMAKCSVLVAFSGIITLLERPL